MRNLRGVALKEPEGTERSGLINSRGRRVRRREVGRPRRVVVGGFGRELSTRGSYMYIKGVFCQAPCAGAKSLPPQSPCPKFAGGMPVTAARVARTCAVEILVSRERFGVVERAAGRVASSADTLEVVHGGGPVVRGLLHEFEARRV